MPNDPVKVVLVEDETIVREGLRQLLDGLPFANLTDAVDSAVAAEQSLAREHPDLVIADLVLRDGPDGVQLTKAIKARTPRLPVLILSGYDEGLFAEQALAAGASGFIMKSAPLDTLIEAMRVAVDGGIWVSDDVRRDLVDEALLERARASLPDAVDDRLLRELRTANRTPVGLSRALGWSVEQVESALLRACRRLELPGVVGLYLAAA